MNEVKSEVVRSVGIQIVLELDLDESLKFSKENPGKENYEVLFDVDGRQCHATLEQFREWLATLPQVKP